MSSIQKFKRAEISKNNPLFSSFKTMIESAFYGNNVLEVSDVATAYELAKNATGTVTTDIDVQFTHELDLPSDCKVLVDNCGGVVGRTASARRIIGYPGVNPTKYEKILREAIYQGGKKTFYAGHVVVGLAEKFMVRSHVLLPKGYENNLYSYLLNFQIENETYKKLYQNSDPYNENDLYIFGDPDWQHPDYPDGLAIFDPKHNVAAILGLRYFGEFKKATLTLAWGTAHRNGFVACHGGMKQFELPDKKFTMAAFGLSGSGKSTITLAKHGGKYPVTVLHDDAFVISLKDGSTVALEPAYFDKTQDYPMDSEAVQYFLTAQNVGVTLDDTGKKVLVTEDIRNGNGRTVKSRYATPNRVDYLSEKIDAVFWIMKDDALPPVVKIHDPVLAAVFGVTLATKRSTAENFKGDMDQLVIEPFANPFRVYPLGEDYSEFRNLFEKQKTACYILNTGFFKEEKVTPQVTLSGIEAIATGTAEFQDMGPMTAMSYLPIEGFMPDFTDHAYLKLLKKRIESRLSYIQECKEKDEAYNALPEETSLLMQHLLLELENFVW